MHLTFTELDAKIRILSIAVDFEQMTDGREPDHDRDADDLAFCAWKFDAVQTLKDGLWDSYDTYEDSEKHGNSFISLNRKDCHGGQGATARLVCPQDRRGYADHV